MILYFLHIPKTSGTALTRFLDAQFEPDRILAPKTWNQFHDRRPPDLTPIRLLRGHFGVGAQHLFSEPLTVLSILRDPVERTLSQYNHLRIDRKHNNWAPEDIPLPPIEQALHHPFWQAFFSNTQTRYLGLDLDPLTHLEPKFLFDSWEEFMYPSKPIEQIHACASRRLHEIAFVGTQERLDDTVRHISARLGWSYAATQPAMVLPGRLRQDELDPSVIRRIRDLNVADQALHALAQTMLDARIEECRDSAATRSDLPT